MRVANNGGERRMRGGSWRPENRFELSGGSFQEKVAGFVGRRHRCVKGKFAVYRIGGKRPNVAGQFSIRLFHAADTDVKRGATRHGSDAHNFRDEFPGAVPGCGSWIFKRDFQVLPGRVLALTAKAHALC